MRESFFDIFPPGEKKREGNPKNFKNKIKEKWTLTCKKHTQVENKRTEERWL
jgi:hypothetical protein